MGMVIIQLVYCLCLISFVLALQRSKGLTTSPSPATSSDIAPIQGTLGPVQNGKSFSSNAPSSVSQPIGSFLPPEVASPPLSSPPEPQTQEGLVPSLPPSITEVFPPFNTAPPPVTDQGHVPAIPPANPQGKEPVAEAPVSLPVAPAPPPITVHVPAVPPAASQGKEPVIESPVSLPAAPVPVETPSRNMPHVSPAAHPSTPEIPPVSSDQRNSTDNKGPVSEPITPVSIASPPRKLGLHPPVTIVSAPSQAPQSSPIIHPTTPRGSPLIPDHEISPVSSPPPINDRKRRGIPVSAPSYTKPQPSAPVGQIPVNGSSAGAPSEHEPPRHFYNAPPPLSFPNSHNKRHNPPASSPSTSFYKHHHARNKITNPAPAPSYTVYPPPSKPQGPTVPPEPLQTHRQRHYASSPSKPGSSVSPSHSPFSRPLSHVSPAPTPSHKAASSNPKTSPPSESPKVSFPPPLRAFPPPPPNEDCSATICTEPYTNTPPGSPCGCVLPIQVGLRLSVALYTFFPLVAELAQEIAAGVFIKQSQVRIIGANAANQQPDKTVVLVDLVPLGERFDNTTAFLTYQRFWNKQVTIQVSYFGDYEVLYVRYPGLPPSPPSAGGIIDDGPYPGTDSNARTIKPFGVDVPKKHHKKGLSNGIIAIIALSSSLAVILCSAVAWIFLFKRRDKVSQQGPTQKVMQPSLSKPSGAPGSLIGSRNSFASLSFGSSIATYTGSAKTFSASDIERATDHFSASKVLGEGGFGRVYSGVLEDGTKVAVKVLKRDDQQGGREFLAEVEMLSRLHHRNLVKLIAICIEERSRCLVYELIPNGSVESHLHGVDKETAPLNWGARMKIALGAGRGLAYLHEDSSPRVIHRDFKSSNILLEDDFTPKVSDFGLARTALDEENQHISTRVMGTFGYVAPEYAMTGHLLVKSDVYSYGVVLLELLTGRKPVDMSQPPGQENLVAWARPLLTSKEGLEMLIDPSLGSDVPFDNVAKVAAIASMCVQPEVSNRPFMGEVVQALKLVCNEIEEAKELGSRTSSREDLSIDLDASEQLQSQHSVHSYESELDLGRGMSASELFSTSARLGTEQSESFRRHSSSGPLGSRRSKRFWQRVRGLSGGSVSEHGFTFRLWSGSH
ncbi:receptor-like serine/threonine-protein kinase ALE2 isoform X2 [Morus notabilis]|uniref:receptor-like serine/threonine-protein kinase ALE2 isoform X2 n=1 Tax=Morus notabilis TaxID=981085 RepID=UPI000CED2E40|nr:receptor-like serine/threonine-protein kinase ALE2 isoform X2 [Morus notabilis]